MKLNGWIKMNVHELAHKMNLLINSKVEGNEDEWLAIDDELIAFNKTASAEEIFTLRKECPKGEIFCIIADGIRHDKISYNNVANKAD